MTVMSNPRHTLNKGGANSLQQHSARHHRPRSLGWRLRRPPHGPRIDEERTQVQAATSSGTERSSAYDGRGHCQEGTADPAVAAGGLGIVPEQVAALVQPL